MRVLLVNSYYYPEIVGGAEVSVQKLAEALVKSGEECDVLCTASEDIDETIGGVPVHRRRMHVVKRATEDVRLSPLRQLLSRAERLYNPKNASILEAALERLRPEVIHTNGLYDISPVVWKLGASRGIPIVHTLRDYVMVCPRSSLTTHAEQSCQSPHLLCRAYTRANLLMSSWVDAVTAPSEVTLNTVLGRGLFTKASASVIPNAIDVDPNLSYADVSFARRGPSDDHPFTVAFLGTLSKKKGIIWLLEAFAQVDVPARLLVAGDGELRDVVVRRAEEDGRIDYRGFLDEGGVRDMLAESHVLVCPSLWDEPFGRVVLDAYRAGIPVIASRAGALADIVCDGKTGMLVECNDVRGLTDALCCYALDANTLLEHSRNAFNELRRYSVDEQAHTFARLYRNLAMKGGRT